MVLKRFGVLFLGLICLPSILGISEEMQELANQLHNSCVDESGTSEDDITNARTGQFSEDEKFKCYIKCLMDQMAVIEEDGDMDPEALIAVLPEEMHEALRPTVNKCVAEGMKNKPDACAVAWETFRCYYNTDTKGLSDEMKELAQQLHNTCVEETGVKEELIDKVNNERIFEDDENLKCYIHCLMAQMACIDDEGIIDEEATLAVLPEEYHAKAEPVIRKCGTKIGSSPCENAWLTHKCYLESNNEYMLI